MWFIKFVLKKILYPVYCFRRTSLKNKIVSLIIMATLPIIISGMLNFVLNRYYMSEYFSIHERLLIIDSVLDDTFALLPLVREYISDPLLTDNKKKIESINKNIRINVTKEIMTDPLANSEARRLFLNDLTLYLKMCEEIVDAAQRNDQSVRSNFTYISYQADNVKRSSIDLTMEELSYGSNVRKDTNNKIFKAYLISSVIVSIIIIIVFILISIVMKNMIIGLKELKNLSQKVTHGEYDLEEIKIVNKDEIGLLGEAFNEMVHSLKSAYNEIDKRQNELELLNKNLTDTNTQLIKTNTYLKDAQAQIIESEKLASLGSLVAGVSHEINTPVGVSVTAASFLNDKNKELSLHIQNHTLTKKGLEDYSGIINETTGILMSNLKRASELIGSFKKIAVDQTSENCGDIILKDYIEDVILSLKHIIKKTSIEIMVMCEDNNLKIKTYPGSLVQLFTNLIMNSISHGFDNTSKGTITISTRLEAEKIIIQYADDGKGMDKEILKRIFEPFYTTKRGQGGSGLGLFIVYNIVTTVLNGSIECESSIGNGVLFTITLPMLPTNASNLSTTSEHAFVR